MKIFVKNKNQLKEKILVKGFSQRSLAREAGIAESYINQIINGCRNPSGKVAHKICEALETDFYDIFFIDNAYKSKIM